MEKVESTFVELLNKATKRETELVCFTSNPAPPPPQNKIGGFFSSPISRYLTFPYFVSIKL